MPFYLWEWILDFDGLIVSREEYFAGDLRFWIWDLLGWFCIDLPFSGWSWVNMALQYVVSLSLCSKDVECGGGALIVYLKEWMASHRAVSCTRYRAERVLVGACNKIRSRWPFLSSVRSSSDSYVFLLLFHRIANWHTWACSRWHFMTYVSTVCNWYQGLCQGPSEPLYYISRSTA